jgi:DNA-binding XRE family transcriptional regulator
MIRAHEKILFNKIGQRLKELRVNAGYSSQENFAYDANVPRALYGKYEKGCNITMSSLFRIISFHKISFEEFFSKGFEDINLDS